MCFFLIIRRPPHSTRTRTLFPTRRSSDLVARDAPRGGGTPTKRNETPPDSRRPAVRHFAKSVPRCCTGRAARRRHPPETPRNRTLRSSGPPASRSGRLRLVDGDGGPPNPPGLRFLEPPGGPGPCRVRPDRKSVGEGK